MIRDGSTCVVLVAVLHRSLEHVQTSAAPFFRHLLVPSSQQPLSNTTPFTNCLTHPLLLMRSVHSWTGSWTPLAPSSITGSVSPMPPLQGVPLCPPHTWHCRPDPPPKLIRPKTVTYQARTKLGSLKPRNILRHGPLGEMSLSSTTMFLSFSLNHLSTLQDSFTMHFGFYLLL